MKTKQRAQRKQKSTTDKSIVELTTTPECLSAAVLTLCQNIDHAQFTDMIAELERQSSAVHNDDMERTQSMLIAQAHTLDGLFARLASNALTAERLDMFERYMRLALKAQSQARTTLQTLAELKVPKQVAFVRQANIGNQIQVNNGSSTRAPARAEKNKNEPNELLEVEHGERLDTRAAGTASGVDLAMAPVGEKHRADKRRR